MVTAADQGADLKGPLNASVNFTVKRQFGGTRNLPVLATALNFVQKPLGMI
jgi:hypothetical protein